MEFNQPSEIVKDLNFGEDAKSKVISGVDKLAQAVKYFPCVAFKLSLFVLFKLDSNQSKLSICV